MIKICFNFVVEMGICQLYIHIFMFDDWRYSVQYYFFVVCTCDTSGILVDSSLE